MKSKYLSVPYLLWMLIFTIVPLFLVVFFALTDKNGNFTLDNLISVGKYSNVFIRSIYLGGLSTLLCLILGYPLAYIISKTPAKNQNIIILLIMLPMWMNFLLRTYAWMTILENNGIVNHLLSFLGFGPINLINTQGAVVFGMVYNFLPYMILPIYSVIVKIDHRIIEAAQDLGAGKRKVFSKILLPLSISGIISGVTMVFVPAVSTFIISKMLGGGSSILIGDLIEMQFLGSSYNPHLGSAISFVLMILILICIGIMNQFDDIEIEDSPQKLM
ncbi:MAG: spermidine/putrescine transport system permease protein PotB [Eubacteriales bacterium SKADARSKE-1]|nr:spermidine/putrescine transport system permease protein PotB [Eubacteriales bacterium SKADARSKE-1]